VPILWLCFIPIINTRQFLLTKHSVTIRNLNKHAILIHETANYIDNNKVILPINLSDNWLEVHFSNYLGVDKPLIILENYEAQVGWFPVKWSPQIPSILLNDRTSFDGIKWTTNTKSEKQKQIDYVFIYGRTLNMDTPNWQEFNECLESNFTLKHESIDKYLRLYENIHTSL
jgi:hypothetical protein